MGTPLPIDLQTTLDTLMVNIQKMMEENKQIHAAIHEQARQNKVFIEAVRRESSEKGELIRNSFESVLNDNYSDDNDDFY